MGNLHTTMRGPAAAALVAAAGAGAAAGAAATAVADGAGAAGESREKAKVRAVRVINGFDDRGVARFAQFRNRTVSPVFLGSGHENSREPGGARGDSGADRASDQRRASAARYTEAVNRAPQSRVMAMLMGAMGRIRGRKFACLRQANNGRPPSDLGRKIADAIFSPGLERTWPTAN